MESVFFFLLYGDQFYRNCSLIYLGISSKFQFTCMVQNFGLLPISWTHCASGYFVDSLFFYFVSNVFEEIAEHSSFYCASLFFKCEVTVTYPSFPVVKSAILKVNLGFAFLFSSSSFSAVSNSSSWKRES